MTVLQTSHTEVQAIESYYVRLEEASEALAARSRLRALVEEWWEERGWGKPPLPDIPNLGILSRNIAAGSFEDIVFAGMARQAGLVPAWSTYHADTMCAHNPDKAMYLAGHLVYGRGRAGGLKTVPHHYLQPVDTRDRSRVHNSDPVHRHSGQTFGAIQLPDGRQLVDVHAMQQEMALQPLRLGKLQRYDVSSWYARAGFRRAEEYYIALLSVCVAHGVLFEDFHCDAFGESLRCFTNTVFEPTFRRLNELFGVAPLLVPLPWKPEYNYFPASPEWPAWGVVPEELLQGLL
jgi:hypothetical protein